MTRRVRLRSGPSTEFPVRRVLEPNTIVAVLETDGSWLLVDAFDFVEFDVYNGWVYKRYLRKLGEEL